MMVDIGPKNASMDENAGMFTCNHEEIDQDLSYLTTFEDEVTGSQHYLPGCDVDCFDHPVGFETFNSLEGINFESFSSAFEYDQIKFDGDGLALYLAQEGEEPKAEGDSNGQHGTDKNVVGEFNLQLACEEIILDTTAEKLSNWSHGAWERPCPGNMALESHTSLFQERGCHAETSNFSSSKNCSEIVNGLNLLEYGKTFKLDAQKAFCLSSASSSGGALDSTDFQSVPGHKHEKTEKLADRSSLKGVSSPLEKVRFGSASESNTSGVIIGSNLIERPATEELQEKNSDHHHRKGGASSKNVRDRSRVFRSLKQNYKKGLDTVRLVCQEESLGGSCIEVPFGLRVQKGQSTKITSLANDFDYYKDSGIWDSNEDSNMDTSADSQDDDASEGDYGARRKKALKRRQHRRWTSSEVIKLIEGVSEHGVGKWTHIKKSLFSSSSYRTSINLKDKWRNLLKASSNEMIKGRKVEQRPTQAAQQLPEYVWRRVRELAVMYSYPRESKIKGSSNT